MKNTYIHEIETIFAENNELILLNENQQIVINIDNFICIQYLKGHF